MSHHTASPHTNGQEIAIIGMAGRFPGAADIRALWKNICAGVESTVEFSAEDLIASGVDPSLLSRSDYVRRGAVLDDADCFDASFFGMTPREAQVMDPQHRIFLECAWSAIEDAGYDIREYKGLIGLFGGVARNTYYTHNLVHHEDLLDSLGSYQAMLATDKEYAVTRTAFILGLNGPCVNVQTACSTSGVAIHLACQSILNGECDMALAGGVRIRVPLRAGYIYEPDGIPSPDGRCYAFDARANGALIGSGAAFILLKSLQEALQDRDSIYAVIKGSAVNNDGSSKVGFTAPSVAGQARVIEEALAIAGISPDSLGLVEAHGTGTSLGDPIEIAALTQAFRKFTSRKCFCPIGSIKTNIGHLDAGAGVAGTIKCALALQHQLIPPSLNFTTPNPQIDFENSPFFVNTELRKWVLSDSPRRAAVSSFGLGGTNFHAILEEPPQLSSPPSSRPAQLFLLSAKTSAALDTLSESLANFIEASGRSLNLADLAYTLHSGRVRFNQRKMVVCEDPKQAIDKLRAKVTQSAAVNQSGKTPTLTFMFPGVGSQYVGMGFPFYQNEPVFRSAFDECLSYLPNDLATSLLANQYPSISKSTEVSTGLENPMLTVLSIFITEYSLAKLLISWGIQPTGGMIGHSLGEYTAACISGVLYLEDALKIVQVRGDIFSRLPEGRMVSVPLSVTEVQEYLRDGLSLAVVNTPGYCVISGSTGAIQKLIEDLEKVSIEPHLLHTRVGLHSTMLDPFLAEFHDAVSALRLSPPQIPFISNLTGNWISESDATSPDYWTSQLRQTVLFTDGLGHLLKEKNNILLEVGPGTTLTSLARIHPERTSSQITLSTLPHPKENKNEYEVLLTAVGQLWISGITVSWEQFYRNEQRTRIHLPTYPFERKRFWIDPPAPKAAQKSFPGQNSQTLSQSGSISREQGHVHSDDTRRVSHVASTEVLEEAFDTRTVVLDRVKQILSNMSGMDVTALGEDKQFLELGFDSLFLTQVNVSIQKEFGVRITFKQIFDETPSVGKLADYLLKHSKLGIGYRDRHSQEPEISADSQGLEEKVSIVDAGEEAPRAFGPWRPIPKGAAAELTTQQRNGLDHLINWYTQKTRRSKQLAESQRKHLADPRAVSHFRKIWKEMVYQIATRRSYGSRIWDIDGNEYVDLTMGFGINLLGHSPDIVTAAVQEQLKQGVELGVLSPLASELAELICEFTGHERVNFVTTGSEAVMAAIRAARTVTGRDRIAFFAGDYHGIFDEVLARPVRSGDKIRALPVAPGIPVDSVGRVLILDYEDPNCLDVLQTESRDLAAVIVEPVQSRCLDRQPREILQSVRRITEQSGTALIFDEVITGFRLAGGGAQEWYGIQADLAAYGKTISGGFPLAAVAGKSCFMDAFDGGQWRYGDDSFPEAGVTFFGGTFVRHPAGLAAGIAVLRYLKEQGPGLQIELNERTQKMTESINECFAKVHAPIRLTNCGSMLHFHFLDENDLSRLLFFYMRGLGVHVWDRPVFLSTAHSQQDIQFIIDSVSETLKRMESHGFLQDKNELSTDENHTLPYTAKHRPYTPAPVSTLHAIKQNHSKYDDEDGRKTSLTITKDKVPITDNQLEIWLSCQAGDAASCVFNGCHIMDLHGPFQPDAMRQALQDLVMRHDSLRITFAPDGSSQRIWPSITILPREIDLSVLDVNSRDEEVKRIIEQECRTPFNLETGPLLRLLILKLEDHYHRIIFSTHHIICDGWSKGVLWRDLSILYSSRINGMPAELGSPVQFRDYAALEKERNFSAVRADAKAYWLHKYETPVAGINLPTDRPHPPIKSFQAGQSTLTLRNETLIKLRQFAGNHGLTIFSTLLGAFYALLHRLSSSEDLVIGVAVAGQSDPSNQNLTGHSVSLLPIRKNISVDIPAVTFVRDVMSSLWEAYDHRTFGFGQIVKALNLPRDLAHFPLVSVIATHETQTRGINFAGLECKPVQAIRKYCNFDLELYLVENEDTLTAEIDFNTDVLEQATVQRWLSHYETLLKGILEEPGKTIADLPLLSDEEWERIVVDWNQNKLDLPDTRSLNELFEARVREVPDAIAVSFKSQSITYTQLNQKANQLARYLRTSGVHPEKLVGICMDRSIDLIIGLMGILKAGGAYVPLDPAYPSERIDFMLEDSCANVILTQSKYHQLFHHHHAQVIQIDRDWREIERQEATNLEPLSQKDNLAYVIYTSGSTGKPKGVAIEHGSTLAFIEWAKTIFSKEEMSGVLASTSICFDLSVFEIFVTLSMGGRIVLVQSALELLELPHPENVSLINTVPSAIREILSFKGIPSTVTTVCLAGELLHTEIVREIYETTNVRKVYDLYGPSEDTTYSTWTLRSAEGPPTIGRPIANTQLYILDARRRPVPVGVPGEIYLGGAGLARGYYHRPELTDEKFVENPFSVQAGSRLYRTGDLARFRPDGNVELIGRIDHQVKIRGFRIELGEIEFRLREHPMVLQSVVVAREDPAGEKSLAAYFTTEGNITLPQEELRTWLKETLPPHMIPPLFIQLDKLPLTLNGKVDRKQLPPPPDKILAKPVCHTTGSTAIDRDIIELSLIKIWEEVLGKTLKDPSGDFFEIGGHSLASLRVVHGINEHFGTAFSPLTLFQYPTITSLVDLILRSKTGNSLSQSVSVTLPIESSYASTPSGASQVAQDRQDEITHLRPILEKIQNAKGRKGKFRMRESWICARILRPLFKFRWDLLRRILVRLITRLEGGEAYTVTLRKIWAETFDVHIGDYSSGVFDLNRFRPGTTVGRYCSISGTARTETANHPMNTLSTSGFFFNPATSFAEADFVPRVRLKIGNDVFLGHNVHVIVPTEEIGDGAVIGSGSVVAGNVPPFAVMVGYPATAVRYRFSAETIAEIMKAPWWEKDLDDLAEVREEFTRPVEGEIIR